MHDSTGTTCHDCAHVQGLSCQCCKLMQQSNCSMSGIAVTMIMVLVIKQYAACCWKGASVADSARACMHALAHGHSTIIIVITMAMPFASCLWVCQQHELQGLPPVKQSHLIALQCRHHPAALVLMLQSAECLRSACASVCSLSCMGCCPWRKGSFRGCSAWPCAGPTGSSKLLLFATPSPSSTGARWLGMLLTNKPSQLWKPALW